MSVTWVITLSGLVSATAISSSSDEWNWAGDDPHRDLLDGQPLLAQPPGARATSRCICGANKIDMVSDTSVPRHSNLQSIVLLAPSTPFVLTYAPQLREAAVVCSTIGRVLGKVVMNERVAWAVSTGAGGSRSTVSTPWLRPRTADWLATQLAEPAPLPTKAG